jgi:hypothetical protein
MIPSDRRYLDFHWGVPCAHWLRTPMTRVGPELFSAGFMLSIRPTVGTSG